MTPRTSPRLRLAFAGGRIARWATRMTGRAGDGVHSRGTAICAIDPHAIERLAAGRRTVIVTGGNGKTTTSHLLARALGDDVAHNATGANMQSGVVTALADSDSPIAVLEVDELYVKAIAPDLDPEVVVLLNIARDRPGFTDEVGTIVRGWTTTLRASRARVVANAADPNVVAATPADRAIWFDPGSQWREDARACPRCGQALDWTPTSWSCRCGLAQPDAAWRLVDDTMIGPEGRHALRLAVPGRANRANAVAAAAAARAMGVDVELALARMSEIRVVAGRYSRVDAGGRPGMLVLVKNAAGIGAALEIAGTNPLIIGMNARPIDGHDMYEMSFASLSGRAVGATGEARHDLARLLREAGAEPIVDDDLARLSAVMPAGDLVLIANHSLFGAWRRRDPWLEGGAQAG